MCEVYDLATKFSIFTSLADFFIGRLGLRSA